MVNTQPDTHLILTVGTGTAGKESNLTQGLINTIKMLDPKGYWLVPSASSDSTAQADLIREERPQGFMPWSLDKPYCTIDAPDDLEACRMALKSVIEQIGGQNKGRVRVLINPTSGTKQMSVGAALAALDAGLGEMIFTVGERADGVVRTGTERLASFDASGWRAEKALTLAHKLFQAGAYTQAKVLLEEYAGTHPQMCTPFKKLCELAEAWSQRAYANVSRLAGELGLSRHTAAYATLAQDVAKATPEVVSESFSLARHMRKHHQHELAVMGLYRTAEVGLRLRVVRLAGSEKPWRTGQTSGHPIPPDLLNALMKNDHPGVQLLGDYLDHLEDVMGNLSPIRDVLRMRNEMTHTLAQVSPDKVQAMEQKVRDFLKPLGLPDPVGTPKWSDVKTGL